MTEDISLKKTSPSSDPKGKRSNCQRSSKSQRSCCLFERSSGNILNLRYDSKVLEKYYHECSLLHAVDKFRFSSIFSMVIAIVWIIYFSLKIDHYICHIVFLASAVLIFGIILGLTFAKEFFKKWHTWLYLVLGLVLGLYSMLSFFTSSPSVSLIFNLFLNIQTILLLYTMIPVRLWQAMMISSFLSIVFIVLVAGHYGLLSWRILTILILLELVVHEVGLVHHLMSQARRRSTFLKLGQSAQLKREIRTEQKTKDEMIQSLMPVEVAHEVMSSKEGEAEDAADVKGGNKKRRQSEKDDDSSDEEAIISNHRDQRRSTQIDNEIRDPLQDEMDNNSVHSEIPTQQGLVHFRKFHVNQLKNVSILFADIVGFTKMSSNKTAPHLVFLLNDLFGSFDKLCEVNGCEKIATLGDCYYCVCGCPKEVEDHAERCVEMGRSMCKAIRQFDERHNEEVNMRVGVHTGMVICGIVGTHRFKFDVWSYDVTLANEMESSGEAGRVHISEETYEFVKDIYEVEEGPLIPDIRKLKVLVEYFDDKTQSYAIKHEQDQANIKTYFIVQRKDEKPEVLLITDEENKNTQITFSESNADDSSNNKTNALETNATATDLMLPNSTVKIEDQETLDKEMIVNFKEENADQIRSFFEPPINYLTLNFKDSSMERRYHRNGLRPHKKNVTQITWSTLRVTPFINAVVSCLFLVALIIACLVAFPCSSNYQFSNRIGFYIALVLIICFNILFVVPLVIDFIKLSNISRGFAKFYRVFFNWYLRNLYGVIILGVPSVLVLCHFDKCLFTEYHFGYRIALGIMLIFMLGNCTLFTIYSSWTKSCVATVIVAVAVATLFKYRSFHYSVANITAVCGPYSSYLQSYNSDSNFLTFVNGSSPVPLWMKGNKCIDIDIAICLFLTLIFIWYLNRELDISFRASFNCDHQAVMARKTMAQERKQADWLLENIIPSFVIEDIKTTKKYSKHMEQTGVIFATIANFGDFYDEQFEGGREMLRVLNEIFADFENLLPNPKYKDVQKIKTIGACFMAASGLNPIEREKNKKPDSHLYALMDFSMDLIQTLHAFNEQLFNFNFELKIGFNIGDVTAGVIGTTKLLYDIWGDTVNVASRMYSTGEKGKIQVTEAVAKALESRYDFTYRGEVEVKGKGKMKTYLLVGKKGAKRDNPSPLKH